MLSYMSPQWFNGYDVVLELLFAVITIIVALFAYRTYKTTNLVYSKYLSLAFMFIGFSYIVQSVINFLILTNLNQSVCGFMKINSIAYFNTIAMYVHMIFFTVGLVLLAYMTFKIEKKVILFLLLALSFIVLFFGSNSLYMFYLLSSIYLMIVSLYFVKNYLKNRKFTTMMIAIAFLFLLFGSIHFLFSVNHQLFYVIGHLLEFVAYVLILINLIMVRKK